MNRSTTGVLVCGLIMGVVTWHGPRELSAATSVATVPQGYLTLTISAGTASSVTVTTIGLPLHGPVQGSGQVTGVITGVTADTIANTNAGWTAGAFSNAATPYAIKITSGAAAGRILVISSSVANTATVATVNNEGTDLTTLGIVAGADTYEVMEVDTLSSLFGTPATTGVMGGTSVKDADAVQVLNSSGWTAYFYSNSAGKWFKAFPQVDASNVVIRPDQGIMYIRRATTDMRLILQGRVPSTDSKIVIRNSGVTFIGAPWPTSITLATSGIQNLPGWVKSSDYKTSDIVQILQPSGWQAYYHDGTSWMKAFPVVNADSVAVNAGTSMMIIRRGSATGVQVLAQSLPYNLSN